MSFVFLTDGYVYKVKKPVDLDELKEDYPNLDVVHLIVDTRYELPQDWYITGIDKR